VRGGEGGDPSAKASGDTHCSQKEALCHSGASSVKTEGRDVLPKHAEAGADTLIQEISQKNGIQILFLQGGLLQGKLQGSPL
jgi:hypothetical protein